MTDREDVLRHIDEAADAVVGAAEVGTGGEQPPDRFGLARAHLDQAWRSSAAGTELPPDARLRPLKRRLLAVNRPVTAQQVPFNRELVAAVDQLSRFVADLAGRLTSVDERARTATRRLQAAVASTDLAVDDLSAGALELHTSVEELRQRLDAVEQRVADQRAELRTLRSRHDLVLRALAGRAADAGAVEGGDSPDATVSGALSTSVDELDAELATLVWGPREELLAARAALLAELGVLPPGPVVDLAAGRGEWLEALRDAHVESYGFEDNAHLAAAARHRGLDVRDGDPVAALEGLDPGTVAAVTAFDVAGRLPIPRLVELVDRALAALRPGGLLVVDLPNVEALDVGASEVWLDPTLGRPLHPAFVELLALARGFAEAEVRRHQPVDELWTVRADDLGAGPGPRTTALADRLNRLLAAPRRATVLARKAGAPPA